MREQAAKDRDQNRGVTGSVEESWRKGRPSAPFDHRTRRKCSPPHSLDGPQESGAPKSCLPCSVCRAAYRSHIQDRNRNSRRSEVVAVAADLRVPLAEDNRQAFYLRTFFRILSSWVHRGEIVESLAGSPISPPRLPGPGESAPTEAARGGGIRITARRARSWLNKEHLG